MQHQQADDAKVNNLQAGHIRKIDKITDMFVEPVMIAVKKDRSVKIALDARTLNNAIPNAGSGKIDGHNCRGNQKQERR